MNVGEMKDAVYDSVRDTDRTFVTPAEVLRWLNRAQRDLATRTLVLQDEVASTTSDNTIPIPADAIRVLELRVNGAPVEWVDSEEWNAYSDSFDTPLLTLARPYEGQVEVYPTPSANTSYTLRYARMPAALTVDADIPEVPVIQHDKMVEYATARALWKEGARQEGTDYMSLYEDGLPGREIGTSRLQGGPLNLRYERNAFDKEGVHRG